MNGYQLPVHSGPVDLAGKRWRKQVLPAGRVRAAPSLLEGRGRGGHQAPAGQGPPGPGRPAVPTPSRLVDEGL